MHKWGDNNQVIFDALKEFFVIFHTTEGEGEDFRLLGTWMDTTLRMESNVRKLIARARPKISALLRTKRFYSEAELVKQYKTHVLCLLEINPGGYYHALDTILEPLDQLQRSFLKEINMSEETAFIEHNLAPLCARRDIGMLGLIFKCVHGKAHKDLQEMFPRSEHVKHQYDTKHQAHRHPLQLVESRPGTHHCLLRRSVFGLTRVWNRLPAKAAEAESVTSVQQMLTAMVRMACRRNDVDLTETLSPRAALLKESSHFLELLKTGRPLLYVA